MPSSHPGYLPTVWVLVVRFALMPALSLLFVWLTAGRGWYVSDPLVWCVPLRLFRIHVCACARKERR